MAKAQIKKEHYETFISAGHKKMIADEPLDKGGTDLGMSPLELLESSLAACVAITVRMYADRKQWPLHEINVEVKHQEDQSFESSITRTIVEVVRLRDTVRTIIETKHRIREGNARQRSKVLRIIRRKQLNA